MVNMKLNWVIVCLGVEPVVYGPFSSERNAREDLDMHAPLDFDGGTGFCSNGISWPDHHVLEMKNDGY
jgi:hypothetical protein